MLRSTATIILAVIALTVVAENKAFAAPPAPSFEVSCSVGANTTVSWKHVRVSALQFEWKNSTGEVVAVGETVPHGTKFSTLTPLRVDAGGSFAVTLSFNDGTGAKLEPVMCT